LLNLIQARECVVNVVSEGFIEALNATSINAPYGVSEWDIAGLTPVHDCHTVSCARVKESIFSIETRLESVREFTSRSNPGKKSGCLVLLEVTYFWAREDALNEDKNHLDLSVCLPVCPSARLPALPTCLVSCLQLSYSCHQLNNLLCDLFI
jgi:flavin reductase (DIM6/NTAB) family NADH-FMN oxidoreductase RutF